MAWTADSRAVLFTSDRGGPRQVYRQEVGKTGAEELTFGPETGGEVRLSPDGRWVLYFIPEGKGTKARLMRARLRGQSRSHIPGARLVRDNARTVAVDPVAPGAP